MSYFVVIFFVYHLVQILQQHVHSKMTSEMLLWEIARAVGDEAILMVTILCHEFGHGNMARWLGGEIDHILLWVFGGICFSIHPRSTDSNKTLKNDLLIVAAGPTTHFFQTPVWGVAMWALFLALPATGYASAYDAFSSAVDPWKGFNLNTVRTEAGLWSALPWALVGDAVSLNVWLFLFNVFFPMYPADGSKLLVLILMYCCRVPARCAAIVLLCVSVPCSLYFVGSGVMGLRGTAGPNVLTGVMFWMGLMSLCEAYKIFQLLQAKRVHTHPLFQSARSWQQQGRDDMGRARRINNSDFDDEATIGGNCCLVDCWTNLCDGDEDKPSRGCPCPCAGSRERPEVLPNYGTAEGSIHTRADRAKFLARVEQQSMEKKKGRAKDDKGSQPQGTQQAPRGRDFGGGVVGGSGAASSGSA